ncbi:MAG: FAD-dependent monooxygenase [Nannocystaceae bacterium]
MSSAAKVLIVGAGIGGLTAAIALGRRGIATTVIERAGALAPAGAGITLQPNATAVLSAIGVGFDPSIAAPIGEVAMVDARGRTFLAGGAIVDEAPSPGVTLRRTDLHRALLAGCGPERVRLGVGLVGLEDRPEGVIVRTSDGDEARWDLVIGADGLHSAVRRAILPAAACAPRPAGQTCWRLCVEAPELAPPITVERWTPGRRIGVVPLARGGLYVYLVESAAPGSVRPGSATIGELRRRFHGIDERLDAILERAEGDPSTLVHHGELFDLPVYSSGRGRVVLIGDAGHAVTPNLGQGAAMAIEDAAALALLGSRPGGLVDLPARLAAARRRRVEAIHRTSWRLGQVAHWRSPIARWLRDALLRAVPRRWSARAIAESWTPGFALAAEIRRSEVDAAGVERPLARVGA